jgi:hypothetical protein
VKTKIITLCFCTIASLWIAYNFNIESNTNQPKISTCIFKLITGFPCPSCGTTRATIQVFHGNFNKAILLNPFGIIVSLLLIILPILFVIDLIFKKNLFNKFKNNGVKFIQKKAVIIILTTIIILNWIWNINKHL